MTRIRNYGPAALLAVTALAVLFGGPAVMRDLAYAQQSGRIEATSTKLQSQRLAELSESFREVASLVEPSVVHIAVKKKSGSIGRGRGMPDRLEEFFRQFPQFRDRMPDRGDDDDGSGEDYREYDAERHAGDGSGWVYDKQGHIVTNYHVVKNADTIEVRFFDKTVRTAEIVGADKNTDIAVLKVDTNHLHPATLAGRDPEQGEIVFAFGSPFRFEFSMSQGIVSGSGRQLGILGATGYESFIQTDAAINPGNSGGPLVNIYGQVVGMNTAIATRTGGYQGIGFAIPAGMLKNVIPQLIETGQVARGYLGVAITDDARLLETFNLDHGVVVEQVMPGSPADEAGLKRGDVIVDVDGEPMPDASHLRRTIADFGPDHAVELTIVRNDERRRIEVTLTQMPSDLASAMPGGRGRPDQPEDTEQARYENLRKLGIEAASDVDDRVRNRLDLDEDVEGVIVEKVRAASVAAVEGMRRGVIITAVQGEAIESLDDLADELDDRDLTGAIRFSVMVRTGREWVSRFVVLKLPE
jgi:serine protease Do